MSLQIRLYPDPMLRRTAEPISEISDELRVLADQMLETMIKEAGYGLAAPQIGLSKRLIVVDIKDQSFVLINPEIVEFSDEKQMSPEGCLSIPGVETDVERSQQVVIRGLNLDGDEIEVEAEDLLARVFQHEVDHLNGVLFIDHLGKTKRQMILREFEKLQKEKAAKAAAKSKSNVTPKAAR